MQSEAMQCKAEQSNSAFPVMLSKVVFVWFRPMFKNTSSRTEMKRKLEAYLGAAAQKLKIQVPQESWTKVGVTPWSTFF